MFSVQLESTLTSIIGFCYRAIISIIAKLSVIKHSVHLPLFSKATKTSCFTVEGRCPLVLCHICRRGSNRDVNVCMKKVKLRL